MSGFIPIIALAEFLLVPIQDNASDLQLGQLRAELCVRVQQARPKGVLVDISMLTLVDSFLGRLLLALNSEIRLLGAPLVVVGMRPEVALTVVEMGLSIAGLSTAANLQQGQDTLRRLAQANAGEGDHGRYHA